MEKIFKGEKVTIMGLGLLGGGIGVAKFFCQQGAKVLVTDLKSKKQLKESLQKLKGLSIKFVLGKHRKEDFIDTDLVIKNPGVPNNSPYLKIAKRHKIPIKTDVSIFFELCKVPIVGITGTKGKSTTAVLIYQFLKSKYKDTILAGNIGVSPLEVLSKITKKSLPPHQKFGSGGKVVLELSSFELENLKKSPKVAVITTIFPDHLDRYKSFGDYLKAKEIIFKYQNKGDILILNYDNPQTRKFSKSALSQVYFFSKKFIPEIKEQKKLTCFIKDGKIIFAQEKEPIFKIEDIDLYGEHNIYNVLAAILTAKLLKVPSKNIRAVISKFKGIPNRQEFIAKKKEVKYFNDTTATMPQAAETAIKTFKERFPNSKIILIAGGQDKNLNYKNVAKEIQKNISYLILLPGTASKKIKKELKTIKTKAEIVKIFPVSSMRIAVKKAANIAKKNDIVLLSPGAASFNLFKNEFDRGEQFNKLVRALNKNGT